MDMLQINDYEKLNALLKTLWTIKFDVPPEYGIEIASSPYVAEIYKETYEALISILHKNYKSGEAKRLEEELTGNHSFELNAIEKYIELIFDQWKNWQPKRKKEYINLLISPFKLSDETINELLSKFS